MLDLEITCQADNIGPELVGDLQTVFATLLLALGAALSWNQDGVGVRRRRPRCDFVEQVFEASMQLAKIFLVVRAISLSMQLTAL
jgi:hypothetical protein